MLSNFILRCKGFLRDGLTKRAPVESKVGSPSQSLSGLLLMNNRQIIEASIPIQSIDDHTTIYKAYAPTIIRIFAEVHGCYKPKNPSDLPLYIHKCEKLSTEATEMIFDIVWEQREKHNTFESLNALVEKLVNDMKARIVNTPLRMNKIKPDYRAFLQVMSSSAEFNKLSGGDRNNLAAVLDISPDQVKNCIDDLVRKNKKIGLIIDGELLFKEIHEVWWKDKIDSEDVS